MRRIIINIMVLTIIVLTSQTAINAQTPSRATATANVVNGFLIGVTVTDSGYGYTNVPPVHIIGGGGSNALVTATISNSAVTSITINNPGAGYNTTPLVSIAPPILPLPQMAAAPASQLVFTNLLGNQFEGYAYKLEENLSGVWSSIGPYIGSWSSDYTMIVDGKVTTNTYLLAGYPVPEQATAVAQVTNGFVVGMTLTSYGDGYNASPVVEISGGGGSGAEAEANTGNYQNGIVTSTGVLSITITNPGSGYTSTPSIVIGPPDATLQFASPPIITPEILLDMSNITTNLTYQLQTSPDLITWTNVGASFLDSTPTTTSYLYANNTTGFFRLLYVP